MNTNIEKSRLPFDSSDGIKKEFYDKLDYQKIEINWNKKPINMELFLSFLTIEVTRSINHLGSSAGWTLLESKEAELKIGGGVVGGTEYLDTIQYQKKLSNPYNNYVSPFYIFGILNETGKQFFVDYYKEDIEKLIEEKKSSVSFYRQKMIDEKALLEKMFIEFDALTSKQTL